MVRTDGGSFDFNSFSAFSIFPGFGGVFVDGTTASGGTVSTYYPAILAGFQPNTLPSSFVDLVSVSLTSSPQFPQGAFDDFDVTIVGPPPPDTSGTPGTMTLVSDDRYVREFGQNCTELDCDPPYDNTYVPPSAFLPFMHGATGLHRRVQAKRVG